MPVGMSAEVWGGDGRGGHTRGDTSGEGRSKWPTCAHNICLRKMVCDKQYLDLADSGSSVVLMH
jgi:hypothetical protein